MWKFNATMLLLTILENIYLFILLLLFEEEEEKPDVSPKTKRSRKLIKIFFEIYMKKSTFFQKLF